MGASQSKYDPRHVRIWNNLSSLESAGARIKMLDTLFSAQEYVNAAKQAGVYAALLQWKAAHFRGEFAAWPSLDAQPPAFAYGMLSPPSMTRAPQQHAPPPRIDVQQQQPHYQQQQQTAIATIPPPKRALDVLHQSYSVLGIDDSVPLTHEMLRSAYKRSATRAHPDKGGSPEAFDAVTRAFLYLEEVLNKLVPKSSAQDARFTTPVTPEQAMKQRAAYGAQPAPPGTPQLEGAVDAPPIALNPKKLDMALFNKLFEENKLPDPDKDDGYGDWLKTNEEGRAAGNASALRSKYNADVFNKMFEEEARRNKNSGGGSSALAKYAPPSELMMAPNMGSELGGARPDQYTQIAGANGMNYTDLKYAYGEGSTFSQQVANVSLEGRPKTLEQAKMEYGKAPKPMSEEEAAAVAAFERAKEAAEQQRQQRLAARDVDAEALQTRLKNRLLIK